MIGYNDMALIVEIDRCSTLKLLKCRVHCVQILRVQSPEGTTRVEMQDTDVTAQLFERVYESLHLNTFAFVLHKDRQRKEEITSSKSRRLCEYGLQHGDLLYLNPVNGAVLFDQPSTSGDVCHCLSLHLYYKIELLSKMCTLLQYFQANNKPFGEPAVAGPSSSTVAAVAVPTTVTRSGLPQEDEVDLQLYRMSGSIQRHRDEKL